MDKEQIIKDVFEILGKTFKALDEAYENNKENGACDSDKSRLIFPAKNNCTEKSEKNPSAKNNKRVSEQELRFEFIHQLLNSNKDYYYSVETPTINKYRFSKKMRDDFGEWELDKLPVPRVQTKNDEDYDKKHGCKGENDGKKERYRPICGAAQYDMVLFDRWGKRVALIEFKAGSADKIEYQKDFLKLNLEGNKNLNKKEIDNKNTRTIVSRVDEDIPCFFINLLENFEDSTLERIGYKIQGKDEKNIPSINAIKTDSDIFFITHNVGEYTGKGNDNKHYSLLFAQNDERKNLWNNPFKQEKEEWIIIPYEDGKLELNDDEIKKLVNK